MSMIDTLNLRLKNAKITALSGESLAHTLYGFPVDIYLCGELGAGKTTFLQGFAKALGIAETITSPTYALEQRYTTTLGVPLIHMDLYRLTEPQARELTHSTDTHEGIRCIEWAERLGTIPEGGIHIQLKEEGLGRSASIEFCDETFPSTEDIEQWFKDVRLPPHIAEHCRTVSRTAGALAEHLIAQGTIVRKTALERAGLAHDLLRFIDFKPGAPSQGQPAHSPEDEVVWEKLRSQYSGMKHEAACAAWMRERGHNAIAEIIAVHGLALPSPVRATIEQKLLYYSDKRVSPTGLVSLKERFEDFRKRYGNSIETERSIYWYAEGQRIEKELFPNGPPL